MKFASPKNKYGRFIFFIFFLIVVPVFIVGLYIGYKSVSKKQQIYNLLVSNRVARFFILRNDSRSNNVIRIRKDLNAVNCPKDHLAIASFGQSNSANGIKRENGLISINDGKTFMWDWTTGKCFIYSEPLVGTDGPAEGNILTETIIQLRKNYSGNLIVVAFGRGGSSVFDWSHVKLSIRLDKVLQGLSENSIKPKFFFWHQGEADAIPEIYVPWKMNAYGKKHGSVSHYYESALSVIIDKIKKYFPTSIIGVALVSICNNDGSPSIIDAQKRTAEKYANVKISSNTDLLGNKFRQDGCHFNELGASKIGENYAQLILGELFPLK